MTEERGTYTVRGEVRRETRLPFADANYRPPTPEEIRRAIALGGYTGASAGALLGVTGRMIRKWTGGDREMPYSAWRLLLVEMGMDLAGAVEDRRAADR